MIILGYDFWGDEAKLDYMAAGDQNIADVTIKNMIADELYISNNTTYDMSDIPDGWDYDTIMHAYFNNSLTAGNVDYTADEVSALRLKRREVGDIEWLTLAEFQTMSIADFSINYIDRYVPTDSAAEYAFVAVMGGAEGEPASNIIDSEFEGITLTEKDKTYNAYIYEPVSTERNQLTSVVATLKGRYPYVIKNADTNYTSGTITAGFLPADGCQISEDYYYSTQWREEFTDFLTNGKPKVLKLADGRAWIVNIVDNVQHVDNGALYTTFNFVQTGDVNNSDDLYDAGLIDVNY